MCASRDLFDAHKSHASGSVPIGDNADSMSIRKGMVKIRMFNGIVRTLMDMMHVPGL